MTKKQIEDIEREFPTDGLAGMIYHFFQKGKVNYMTEVSPLPEGGVGLILKGTAPLQERREQFLQLWAGIENIAARLKEIAHRAEIPSPMPQEDWDKINPQPTSYVPNIPPPHTNQNY